MTPASHYTALDAWIDAHFDEEVQFLQQLVRVPTDTPPGNNAPHAERTAELLKGFGFDAEKHAVPSDEVKARGLESITNLIVRRHYGAGKTIALNAHGDVAPPGDGWTHDPYGGEVVGGKLYGRAAAVNKSDFATYAFAVRALEALSLPLSGGIELIFTYDEEFGGELGPGWLLKHNLIKADFLIAAGFSHQVITAHNGCLQLAVTVHGKMAHAAIPDTGIDALQGATTVLNALYEQNLRYKSITSNVEGIEHPYLNVGRIEGGTHTNVVPGKVVLKLDRRMIPEENPAEVEREVRRVIAEAAASVPGISVEVKRLLLAEAWKPDAGNALLVQALQRHGEAVFGEAIPTSGTPLYTDVRLFGAAGIPAAIYGAGPRTVFESNAKRADEHLVLEDLRGATKVVARTLLDLLQGPAVSPSVECCSSIFTRRNRSELPMTLADDSAIAAAATTGESLAQGLNRLPRVGLDGVGNTDESGQLSFEAHKDDGRGAAPAMKAIEFNLPNLPNLPGKQPQ